MENPMPELLADQPPLIHQPPLTDSLLALDPAAQALLFTEARTANTFSEQPVSDEQLRAIVELAKWPPTAANTNPLRILFVNSPAARERLLPLMSEGNRAKTATAPAVAVLAADTDFHEHVPRLLPFRPELKDHFAADDQLRERQARFNSALQAAYFIIAVRAAGLAAGPMGGFDAPGIDAEFFADRAWKSILVVNIGHPGLDPWFDRLPRLDYDEMVTHI
jgi:3-hydroxypropanoate dehydrogenase